MLAPFVAPFVRSLPLASKSALLRFSASSEGNWRGWDSPLKSVRQVSRECQIGIDNVGQEYVLFRLGLTDTVLDEEIAEPRRVEVAPLNALTPEGQDVVRISWVGLKRSSSDELYHANWSERAEGCTGIKLPFAATVLEANPQVLQDPGSLLHPDKVVWILRREHPSII